MIFIKLFYKLTFKEICFYNVKIKIQNLFPI